MGVSNSSGDSVGWITALDSVWGKLVEGALSDGSGITGRGGADTAGTERQQVARGDIPLATAAILRSDLVFGISLAAVVSSDGGTIVGAVAKVAAVGSAAISDCGSFVSLDGETAAGAEGSARAAILIAEASEGRRASWRTRI